MTFKTTQSNRFKPASYEPKPFPKQQIWLYPVIESRTGKIYPVVQYVISILLVFGFLALLHYLGVIKPA